jgi:uncharacterized protein YecE (DUF72 family)
LAIVGTAAWAIPAPYKDRFPEHGSQLEGYATRLNGVEINSSFYRSHRRKTYERWTGSVPDDFRFSVKVPRAITHTHRLKRCDELMDRFLEEVSGLGQKLDILLAQLPPSLAFDREAAEQFFSSLARARIDRACEPRHASWFTPEADKALETLGVIRVAADPPRAPGDGRPGGATRRAYWRLHGSPRIYYSGYTDERLNAVALQLGKDDWCVFDNTAAFQALGNALRVVELTGR